MFAYPLTAAEKQIFQNRRSGLKADEARATRRRPLGDGDARSLFGAGAYVDRKGKFVMRSEPANSRTIRKSVKRFSKKDHAQTMG